MSLNGAVFDLKNELIVKVSADNRVMRAYKGLLKIEDSEIVKIYGEDRTFEFTPWAFRNIEKGHAGFHTFFDCPVISTLTKILELKRTGQISKTAEEIFEDTKTCIIKNYIHYNAEKSFKISDYGYFFPEIMKEPAKYIQKREDFKEMLIKLREMGKLTFLASNSHAEYMEFIMTHSIGEDWKDYFDFISSACSKPGYFTGKAGNTFLVIYFFNNFELLK